MRFSKVEAARIPKGNVLKIREGGKKLWSPILARYVSLGDSIAAGHSINSDWEADYGTGSQYGVNGNTETVIVPGSYTELIRQDLLARYDGTVNATSFARSGERVKDLIPKLDHDVVKKAIAKANVVTICIGANDVLGPAMSNLDEYINSGDSALAEIAAAVEANLAVLADDTNANSYRALFDKLAAINPNAKYVFTTIYNPYKYLWIEEGHHGFFKPVMDAIPTMEFLGIDFDSFIKDSLLGTPAVKRLFSRVNGLDDWAEKYVTKLNNVLRSKINAYGNANFLLADTKAVWDPVPDRPITAPKHYNDLVNVEYTRGWDMGDIHWGRLWPGSSASDFWWGLAEKHGLDIDGLADDFIQQAVEKVISPDVDPHPEVYGQYALERSFVDALGWEALPRRTITFNANGGSGSMASQVVVALDGYTAYANINANAFTIATEGYYFSGWNTVADGSGTAYTDGQFVGLTGDLTLYAQWSNMYTIRYRHSSNVDKVLYPDDSNTGHQECYALTIAGETKRKLGTFAADSGDVYSYPYGTTVTVMVTDYHGADSIESTFYDHHDGTIYKNGAAQAVGRPATWSFNLTSNVDIKFVWEIAGSLPTFDAQSWWDCYITTY